MSCMPSYRRTVLEARLASKQTQLTAAYSAMETMLEDNIESYKFDSNEGSQQVKSRKMESLQKQIDALEATIDQIYRALYGRNHVNMNLRRR
jgi:uncharacterized protein Yka (UPF0111/DUF47 family)